MSDFKEKAKRGGREIFYFLSSPIFLKNVAAMVLLVAALIGLSFLWMDSYTHHGESIQVPSFLNASLADAKTRAQQENLKIVINDSIWTTEAPPGTVIEQSPDPLSRVKENRTIYLTITKFQAEEKELPTLAGNDNYNYYARRLKQLKINLKVHSKQFNNKLEENTILFLYVNGEKVTADDLKDGVGVPQGATVEAVVTTRGGGTVYLPNLVCKKYSEAEFIINGSRLTVSVIKDGTVTNIENSYVWKQSPIFQAGATLPVGATVDVYLTKRPPASCN